MLLMAAREGIMSQQGLAVGDIARDMAGSG